MIPFDFSAGTNGFFLAAPAGLQQAVGRYLNKTAACKTCVARPTSATLVKVISPMYPLHRAALLTALVAPAAATVGKSTYAMSHPFAFKAWMEKYLPTGEHVVQENSTALCNEWVKLCIDDGARAPSSAAARTPSV